MLNAKSHCDVLHITPIRVARLFLPIDLIHAAAMTDKKRGLACIFLSEN